MGYKVMLTLMHNFKDKIVFKFKKVCLDNEDKLFIEEKIKKIKKKYNQTNSQSGKITNHRQ